MVKAFAFVESCFWSDMKFGLGIDTTSMDLEQLRKKIEIIPQVTMLWTLGIMNAYNSGHTIRCRCYSKGACGHIWILTRSFQMLKFGK
jgi:hypothetical protein